MFGVSSCAKITAKVIIESRDVTLAPIARVSRGDETSIMKSAEDVRADNLESLIQTIGDGSVAKLASISGKDASLISRWRTKNPKTRKMMSPQTAREIENVLNLLPNWMDQDHSAKLRSKKQPEFPLGAHPVSEYHPDEDLGDGEVEIPALNVKVGAGNRIVSEPVNEERRFRYSTEWLRRYGLDAATLIRFRVHGQSMEPVIMDRSWITVDTGYTKVKDGMPYLFRSGEQISVKYLFNRPDGGVIIRSHNPSEPDVVVPLAEMEHVTVLGQVVESNTMWRKPVNRW